MMHEWLKVSLSLVCCIKQNMFDFIVNCKYKICKRDCLTECMNVLVNLINV